MDPAQLALLAAQALVQAMTTDGWTAIRERVARRLGTADPGQARRTVSVLDRTRAELDENPEGAASAVTLLQGRFEFLLEEYPELAGFLAELTEESGAAPGRGRNGPSVVQVQRSRRGNNIQAGNDVTIDRSGRSWLAWWRKRV
ncbi:hypothetical protein [Streptomyces sp. I05A-00742]|uniref:hypothetical protein n=1 Tax=Streptomyces sp. I05A-00742 TaxID=2732853 RepID=UPI0014888E1C|nr:hypothetical protein [Streptomyces sp. I05A-00742]